MFTTAPEKSNAYIVVYFGLIKLHAFLWFLDKVPLIFMYYAELLN